MQKLLYMELFLTIAIGTNKQNRDGIELYMLTKFLGYGILNMFIGLTPFLECVLCPSTDIRRISFCA